MLLSSLSCRKFCKINLADKFICDYLPLDKLEKLKKVWNNYIPNPPTRFFIWKIFLAILNKYKIIFQFELSLYIMQAKIAKTVFLYHH